MNLEFVHCYLCESILICVASIVLTTTKHKHASTSRREAKLLLQQKVKNAECDLIWSSVMDFECKNNPFEEHRHAILQWRWLAKLVDMTDDEIIARAKAHEAHGIDKFDAVHIACAIRACKHS